MGNYGGVHRVDPATGTVTATIRPPKNAVPVTFWAGSADCSRHGEHPGASVSPGWTPIGMHASNQRSP